MMKNRLYLAYGSNLNMAQMKSICPSANAVGTAEIIGYGLSFRKVKKEVYLTIEPKQDASVPVGVWEVSEDDASNLDNYWILSESYYKKEIIIPIRSIKDDTVNIRKAFVYIMGNDSQIGIPSLQYVGKCLQGYIDFGLDEHFLAEAQIEAEDEGEIK